MVGIYKITSPSNRVYIGQSKNIKERFSTYKSLKSTRFQTLLHRSFLKYGIINHTFEIIEECLIKDLNNRERYWQEYYDVLKNGLNCHMVNCNSKPRVFSKKTKSQISDTLKDGYKTGRIINGRKGKGNLSNLYDWKGNIILENTDINGIMLEINITNRSSINISRRNEKYISQKKYIILPVELTFEDYKKSLIKYGGKHTPMFQIFKDGTIKKCSASSRRRTVEKTLLSTDLMYYSKQKDAYYTFLGLINKCPFIQ